MGEPPPCCPLSQPPGREGETPSPTPHLSTGTPRYGQRGRPQKPGGDRAPFTPPGHQGGPLTGFLISLSRRRRCSSAALRGMTSGCGSLRGLGGRGAEGAAILPSRRAPPASGRHRARPRRGCGAAMAGAAGKISAGLSPAPVSSAVSVVLSPSPWGFGKGEGRATACPSRSSAVQQPVVSCWGGKTCYMRDPSHTHTHTHKRLRGSRARGGL